MIQPNFIKNVDKHPQNGCSDAKKTHSTSPFSQWCTPVNCEKYFLTGNEQVFNIIAF